MIIKLYSVYDACVNTYNLPFSAITDRAAIRTFQNACSDPNSMLSQNSEDFSLYYIGTFNDEDGTYLNAHSPIKVISATQAINAIQSMPTTLPEEDKQ